MTVALLNESDPWAKYEQAEANIEAAVADMREGWARDAQFIPDWNKMTVAEAIAFVRGGDPEPDLDAPLRNQIPGGLS